MYCKILGLIFVFLTEQIHQQPFPRLFIDPSGTKAREFAPKKKNGKSLEV